MLSKLLNTEEALLKADLRRRLDLQRTKTGRIPTRIEELEYEETKDVFANACAVIDGILADFALFDRGITVSRDRIVRFKYQREIHVRLLAALMQTIFRGEASLYEPELRARYGFESIHQKAHAVMMSRRMGKTMASVLLCVAVLRHVENVTILIIANSFRAARLFNEQIALVLKEMGHTKLDPENQECIGLRFGPSDHRRVWALPGKSTDQLRGIGGNFVIIEEAAFVPLATIKQVVAPILRVGKTAILAISTLGNESNNYFNRIIKLDLFKSYVISLVCDDCLAAGIDKDTCPHRQDMVPPWHDKGMDTLMKALIDDEDTYAKENLGIVGKRDVDSHVFGSDLVESFLRKPRHDLPSPVRYIFMIVDPVPGTAEPGVSRSHDFVITTMSYPKRQLLGMECVEVVHEKDYLNLIVEHAKRVRRIKCCTSAQVVLCVASGVDLQTKAIYEYVQQKLPGEIITTEESHGKRKHLLGLKPADREEMAITTLNGLARDIITISPEFVSVAHAKGPESMLEMLGGELKAFERRIKPGGTRVEYSGTGENKTKRDGCSVAFMKLARFVEGFERLGRVLR
jgi:hypothetical protein